MVAAAPPPDPVAIRLALIDGLLGLALLSMTVFLVCFLITTAPPETKASTCEAMGTRLGAAVKSVLVHEVCHWARWWELDAVQTQEDFEALFKALQLRRA
jgi:hypothetical protein